MPKDTLTLELEGSVSPAEFAQAAAGFWQLVSALQKHVAPNAHIDWTVSDLQAGSASETITCESAESAEIQNLVKEYHAIGLARSEARPLAYPSSIVKAVEKVTGVLNGRITAVRFDSRYGIATVTSPKYKGPDIKHLATTFGAVTGRVQTVTNRGGLRFTLYDLLNDKGISCYLSEGQEELMRGVWGHVAIVEGLTTRETGTGRPVSVKQISDVQRYADVEPGSFREARGAVRPEPGGMAPEQIIRAFRDA